MTITATNRPRYGRYRSRKQQSCAQKATIPVEALERELLAALSRKLQVEDLGKNWSRHSRNTLKTQSTKRWVSKRHLTGRPDSWSYASDPQGAIENFSAQSGNAVAPRAAHWIGGAGAALERVEEKLAETTQAPIPDITEDEVRAFINETAESFGDILLDAPEALKHELQMQCRRISSCSAHHH
jgi:hypothetical protein